MSSTANMGDTVKGAAALSEPQQGYNHSRLPPGDAPQFADHSPAQLKNWLLNTLDKVSQQAREMLGMNPTPTATPTRLSVAGQDNASDMYEKMRVLLETTQRNHAQQWASGGWSPHFEGCLEQLVCELINSPSGPLGVRMGTVVQIKHDASSPSAASMPTC